MELAEYNPEETTSKKLGEEVIELVIADACGSNEDFAMESSDVINLIFQRFVQRGMTEEDFERVFDYKLDRSIKRKEAGTL